MKKKKTRILMIGNWRLDRYTRGRVMYEGLKKNNADVKLFLASGFFKYPKIKMRLLKKDYDIVIPNGKLVMIVTKAMRIFIKKKIVFDVFISDYEALVESRKLIKKGSLKSRIYYFFDRYSCKFSDIVLLDTNEHINYFVNKFDLDKKRFRRIFVGANEKLFYPRKSKRKDKKFRILFYGTFIPGHGIKYILKAAKMLEKDKDIEFLLIGTGQTYDEMCKLSKKLKNKNVKFTGWVNFKKIPSFIADADVCLGMFGDHIKKIDRVIGNKIYEIIAMKKPLITGEAKAMKEAFTDKEDVLFCKMDDEKSLADAIQTLKDNPKLMDKIANNGYKLFKKRFTAKQIGKSVLEVIKEL